MTKRMAVHEPTGPRIQFIAGSAWVKRWDRAPRVGDLVVLDTDRFVVERVDPLGAECFRAFVVPAPMHVPASLFERAGK